jgi:hypothetical protein
MPQPRDLATLRARLNSIQRASQHLQCHLQDLHDIGYVPGGDVGEQVSTGGPSDRPPPAGDPLARKLFARLVLELADVERVMVAAQMSTFNYLMAGTGAPQTRGSLISKADLRAQVANQRKRARRGEYVPAKLETQPGYPGK